MSKKGRDPKQIRGIDDVSDWGYSLFSILNGYKPSHLPDGKDVTIMGKSDDFALLDATAQADLVRRREVQPIDLVEAAIERIERLNPTINAVVTPMYNEARTVATRNLPDGPFTGVPFLLKDLLASYGDVRMTAGCELLREFVPDHDSELVARLKRAGLIILGKTNTPEFGLLPTTEPRLFGPTRNPWNLGRTAGGSSGGSAAAVAAGLVPMAHGNDGGGSIRIPASCCGLFGMKPTRARNSLGPDNGDIMSGLVVEHALTRSVRDCAALLDAASGPAPGDPYCAPPPVRPFVEEVQADPGQLRIAFSIETATGVQVHPDCVNAVKDAAVLCAGLGHEVVEATPELDAVSLSQAFMVLWSSGCNSVLDEIARVTGRIPDSDHVEPFTWALSEMGRRYSASDYLHAVWAIQSESRRIARFFVEYDIWLTPRPGSRIRPIYANLQRHGTARHVRPALLECRWPSRRYPLCRRFWR
jgi:amidase